MKAAIDIETELLEEAIKLTGVKEKSILINLGLKSLIYWESSKRLAKLGGTEKDIKPIPRRRF